MRYSVFDSRGVHQASYSHKIPNTPLKPSNNGQFKRQNSLEARFTRELFPLIKSTNQRIISSMISPILKANLEMTNQMLLSYTISIKTIRVRIRNNT